LQATANRRSEKSDMPGTSPSVLIIRLDGIGDALALTPLLAALRERAIPTGVVLGPGNAQIFSARAAREVWSAPFHLRSSERSNLDAIARFGSELSQHGYTHALVATEDPGGYRLAAAMRAPVRVGFSNGWGKPFKSLWARALLTGTVHRSAGLDARAPHECDVLFSLGRSLLGDALPARDPAVLRPLVLDREPAPGDGVAFQVSDKWERIGIGLDDVVRLIAALGDARRLQLIAAESEGDYADRLSQAAGLPVRRFAALEPWKSAIAQSRAIVTPDSGALHVAGTIGTPVVAVFPPSRDVALQIARWAPWAAPYRSIVAAGDWPNRAATALHELLGAPV
jgi:ADP-heptose:LPS heptosyltransferase